MVVLAEHSDGSLLFRFGDPSEISKNVKIEESDNVKEETETEDNDGFKGEKVLGGDHEADVMVNKEGKELTGLSLTEVVDHTNSTVISSKSVIIAEGESPISISNEVMEVTSSGVDIEDTGTLKEGLNEELDESTLSDNTKFDKRSEVKNIISLVELSDNGSTELTTWMPGPVAIPDNDVFLASLETAATMNESSDSEHQNKEADTQYKIIKDAKVSVKNDLVLPPPSLEPFINFSKEIENQNLQPGIQNLIMGRGIANDVNDRMALEIADISGTNINDAETKSGPVFTGDKGQAYGCGTRLPSEIFEDTSESGDIQLMNVSLQEAEPKLDKETGTDSLKQSTEDDGAESLMVVGNTRPHAENGALVEASGYEVTGQKSTDSATMSKDILMTDFALSSGAALMPHPSKVLTGGEDAYFIAGQTWVGVADGVGLWSLEGTNPGIFAKELTKNCERLISDGNCDSVNDLTELLSICVAKTCSPGSSTILIAQFDGQALHVANIGDSGFIVLRHGVVYKRSSPMYHVFHFPLQIEGGDEPSHLAEFYKVDLEEGDVIITATDGLLDNLYDQEISSIVMKSLAAARNLEEIAELLAARAQEIGRSASARSPFADDAQAAGYAGYTGGKLDDVAVILSVVRRQSNPQIL